MGETLTVQRHGGGLGRAPCHGACMPRCTRMLGVHLNVPPKCRPACVWSLRPLPWRLPMLPRACVIAEAHDQMIARMHTDISKACVGCPRRFVSRVYGRCDLLWTLPRVPRACSIPRTMTHTQKKIARHGGGLRTRTALSLCCRPESTSPSRLRRRSVLPVLAFELVAKIMGHCLLPLID